MPRNTRKNAQGENKSNLTLNIGPIYEEQLGLYALQSPKGTTKNPTVSLSESHRHLLHKCTIHFFLTRATHEEEEEEESSDWELPLGSQNLNKLVMPMKFKLPGMKDIKESKETGYRIKVQVKNEKGILLSEGFSNSFKVLSRYEYLSQEAQDLRDSRHRKKSPQQEFDDIKKLFENFISRNPDPSYLVQMQMMVSSAKVERPDKSDRSSKSESINDSASATVQEKHRSNVQELTNIISQAQTSEQIFSFLDCNFPLIQPASASRKRASPKEKASSSNDPKRVKSEFNNPYDNLPNTNHLSSILSSYGHFTSDSSPAFGFPVIPTNSVPAFDLSEVNSLDEFTNNFEDSSSEGVQSAAEDSENDMDSVLPFIGISHDINAFLDRLTEAYAS